MTPRDYIAEVQALVGCPRVEMVTQATRDDGFVCKFCEQRFHKFYGGLKDHVNTDAPDCATLWGALVAARILTDTVKGSGGFYTFYKTYAHAALGKFNVNHKMTERDAAMAVCRLIVEHRERV